MQLSALANYFSLNACRPRGEGVASGKGRTPLRPSGIPEHPAPVGGGGPRRPRPQRDSPAAGPCPPLPVHGSLRTDRRPLPLCPRPLPIFFPIPAAERPQPPQAPPPPPPPPTCVSPANSGAERSVSAINTHLPPTQLYFSGGPSDNRRRPPAFVKAEPDRAGRLRAAAGEGGRNLGSSAATGAAGLSPQSSPDPPLAFPQLFSYIYVYIYIYF